MLRGTARFFSVYVCPVATSVYGRVVSPLVATLRVIAYFAATTYVLVLLLKSARDLFYGS